MVLPPHEFRYGFKAACARVLTHARKHGAEFKCVFLCVCCTAVCCRCVRLVLYCWLLVGAQYRRRRAIYVFFCTRAHEHWRNARLRACFHVEILSLSLSPSHMEYMFQVGARARARTHLIGEREIARWRANGESSHRNKRTRTHVAHILYVACAARRMRQIC